MFFPLCSQARLSSCCEKGTAGVWDPGREQGEPFPTKEPAWPRYLVPEEEMLHGARALVPQGHQPPAVPDQQPPSILGVLLDGFHWPQCLPTAVIIGHAAEERTGG